MARILGVGIATLDIINTVDRFPEEDSEVRALNQVRRRGGNVTNTLVVLSQLDHQTTWAGTLADDYHSQIIRDDLVRYSVDMSPVSAIPQAHVPTSYVALNQQNGSRTIVHFRDLDEYDFDSFSKIDLSMFDWLHFEGRNIDQTLMMLEHARKTVPQVPRSVEIEKTRDRIGELCGLADLLLYSRSYVQEAARAWNTPDTSSSTGRIPEVFLEQMYQQISSADHVCTWGESGAYGIDRNGATYHVPASKPDRLIDTLGAGDTFMAGMIHGKLAGMDFPSSMQLATELAGKKCGQYGFDGLTL